jgi:hypothetical protein
MPTIKLLDPKPVQLEALQWLNNEAEIREFIQNDGNLRFPGGSRLEVWNQEEKSWINVPPRHYVVKGLKGLYSMSEEVLNRQFTITDKP